MIIDSQEQKKPLSYYFVKGEALKRTTDVLATAVGLANSFLTITVLSVFQFGLYQLVLAFVGIVDGFNINNLDGPVATEMRHHLNEGGKDRAKALFRGIARWRIGFALAVGAAIFFGANLIADIYGDDIGLLLKIVSPLIVLMALESLQTIFLKSIISFAHWTFPAIREVSKLLILVGLFLFNQLTLIGVVGAHVAAQALAVLVLAAVFFLKEYRRVFAGVAALGGQLLWSFIKTHGKWIFLKFGLSRVTKNTIPWFIKIFVNTEAVAFYSLALNAAAMVEGLMPIAGISPLFLIKIGERGELALLFKRAVKYIFWLGTALMVVSWLLVPWLLVLIFPQYASITKLLMLFLSVLPIYGIYKILKSLLASLREYKILTLRLLNEVFIVIVGSVVFLPIFGVIGAAFVYILTFVERVRFFYRCLVGKYPEFKIKVRQLFSFDELDRELIGKIFKQLLSFLKPARQ